MDEFATLSHLMNLIESRHGVDYAAEGVKLIVDLYTLYKGIEKRGFKNYCIEQAASKVLRVGLTVEDSQSKKEWSEAILSVMKAREIVMKAGQNILLRGAQMEAETLSLEAQDRIDLQAAQEYARQVTRNRSIGIHANVNYDAENRKFLAPTIGVSSSYSKSSGSQATNINAHFDVQNFTASSDVLSLEGAVVNAENAHLKARILHMRSLTDRSFGRNRNISGGMDIDLSAPSFIEGMSVSGHYARGSYETANVGEQTGIRALGEFIAEIGETTHLQGAFIDAVNGVMNSPTLRIDHIDEYDRGQQIGFGICNLGFSANSGFVMPEFSRKSTNQKGLLHSVVSSGTQIVTQSNLNHLKRDLSHAREMVKNHKHYVRIVVPIPTKTEDYKEIWKSLKEVFGGSSRGTDSVWHNPDHAWENPDESWANPDHEAICDALDKASGLSDKEKVEALEEYNNIVQEKEALQEEIKKILRDEKARNPYDVVPVAKPDAPHAEDRIESDHMSEYDYGDYPEEPANEIPNLNFHLKEGQMIFELFSKTMPVEEAAKKAHAAEADYIANIREACREVQEQERQEDASLSVLHKAAKGIRALEEKWADYKERHPYIAGAVSGVMILPALGKKIGQKAIAMSLGHVQNLSDEVILNHLEHSDSSNLQNLESDLGINRKDTLTFASLALGMGLPKPGMAKARGSQSALGKKAATSTRPKKPVREMSDTEFVQTLANKVDKRFEGKGAKVGKQKHEKAKKLGQRYQDMHKDKQDLVFEKRFKGGKKYEVDSGDIPKGSVIPDVYNETTGQAYDYKFGDARLGSRQQRRLKEEMPSDRYQGCQMMKPNHGDQ